MESSQPPNSVSSTPSPPPPPVPPTPLSQADERTYAMLAHFSVLLNLVTGFGGIIAALAIYIIFKERSRYVAFQSFQAFMFQLVWWGGSWLIVGASWIITSMLSMILIGLLCIPFSFLLMALPIVPLVWGVVAGIKCNQGENYRYWLVADWVDGMLPKT